MNKPHIAAGSDHARDAVGGLLIGFDGDQTLIR